MQNSAVPALPEGWYVGFYPKFCFESQVKKNPKFKTLTLKTTKFSSESVNLSPESKSTDG